MTWPRACLPLSSALVVAGIAAASLTMIALAFMAQGSLDAATTTAAWGYAAGIAGVACLVKQPAITYPEGAPC